eukprot:TRINITY_DN10582_c0_g2_i1.p1 TRINITY_DN10582_c0_g2~~TRINITY_DN10582_c0_g2_i1.p1  ORF type:complete len:447 (-),score=32.61 TRINITY_DN10582_c0_g2_i1:284-1528(-)
MLLSTLGLVFPLFLHLTLRMSGSRLHVARASPTNYSPNYFGVSDMIPDRHPSPEEGAEEIDLEAWTEIRAVILDRLGKVKDGLVENFCWVSHETILDNENHIVEGGLVVVVQKLAAFRVNFYRMQEFRSWVRIKQLDIGSNERFADEPDVWVVRLTDESQASKEPLPSLNGDSPMSIRTEYSTVTSERLERAEFMMGDHFATCFPIPEAGHAQLIPSLVPQAGESFTFEMQTVFSLFSEIWQWVLREASLGFGMDDIVFSSSKTILGARRPRWSRGRDWTISDASCELLFDDELFHIKPYRDEREHRLTSLSSSQTLFTIRDGSVSHSDLLPHGRRIKTNIFKGDEDVVLYTGVREQTPHGLRHLIYFYHGNATEDPERIAATLTFDVDGRMILHVFESTDASLLLVASAVMSA